MKNKFWKVYILFLFVTGVYTFLTDSVIYGAFNLVGVFVVYSYVNNLKFWKPEGWSIFTVLNILHFGYFIGTIFLYSNNVTIGKYYWLLIIASFMLNAPYFYALIQYSRKKGPIWCTNV